MVTTADNLIRKEKYNFDNGTTCGWIAGGNTLVESSTDVAYEGTRSLKVTRVNIAGPPRTQFVNAPFINSPLPSLDRGIELPELGKPYTLMAHSYCDHDAATHTFESGLGNWNVGGTQSLIIDTTVAHGGSQSLKSTRTTAGGWWDIYSGFASIPIPITSVAGDDVTTKAWVRHNSATAQDIYLTRYYYDAPGSTFHTISSTPVTVQPNTWTLITHTTTIPVGTIGTHVGVLSSTQPASGDSLWIDDIVIGGVAVPVSDHSAVFFVNFYDSSGNHLPEYDVGSSSTLEFEKWKLNYINFYAPNDLDVAFMTFNVDYVGPGYSLPVNSSHYLDFPQLYAGIWTEQPSDPPIPIPFSKAVIPTHESIALSPYTFVTTDLLTSQVVSDVEISSFSFDEVLNRPGSANATVRIEAETTTEENFRAWGNALWCLEGDTVLWGGIIGPVQPRASSRVLNVPVVGFMEYYRHQPIQTTVGGASGPIDHPPNSQWEYGLSYGGHPHGSAVVFGLVDQFRIFEDLIYHVARRDALSDIHPLVTYEQLSGVIRDAIWYNYEYKMVGTACEQLADRENGFFWATHFQFDGNSPSFAFHLNHNLQGTDRSLTFEWDSRPEATNLTDYDFGGLQMPANGVIAVGAGQGAAANVARKEASVGTPIGSKSGGLPRYYKVLTYSDVKYKTTLIGHANKYFQRHLLPYRSGTLSMQNPDPEFTDFDLGDTAYVRVDDHGIQIFDRYRIVARSTVLTPEGDKEVTLQVEEPFIVFEEE